MNINGIAVNFGFSGALSADKSSGIAMSVTGGSGISGVLLQSAEVSKEADMEAVRAGQGDEVVHAWCNQHDQASLEYIVAGTDIATSITNTALQTPGTLITIGTCASVPSLVGTTWEVQSGAKISASNTTAKRISLPIKKFPGITAAAS